MSDADPAAQDVKALAFMTAGLLAVSPASAGVNVTATYEARMLVKFADLRTDTVVDGPAYRLGARLTTIGALGVIKSNTLLIQADGVGRDGAPIPVVYVQTEKGKRRVTRFNGGAGWRSLADPLTQLMRAELQPGGGTPCVGDVPVYDGRQRYDLRLTPAGGGQLTGAAAGLGLQRPVRCRFGFRAISGFGGSSRGGGAFMQGDPVATFAYHPQAQVWVLTEIAIPTVVGTGRIALTGAHVSGVKPAFPSSPPEHVIRPAKRRR